MNKTKFIPYALLLIALLAWLFFKPQVTLTALSEHHPSYIAYNIDNTHFDETGRIAHKIFATKATNFSNDQTTLFKNPKIIVFIKNESENPDTQWEISSDKGVLFGQNKLILSNNVWVKNLTLDQLVQTMHTEELTLLLNEKEISSPLFVSWEGPQMRQQGVGLWSSLQSEELIMNKQIKAIYLNEKK